MAKNNITQKVSCIIPAHNEAERIGSVLQVVSSHLLISEVIVVQNFSTDNTSAVVRKFIQKKNKITKKIILLEEYKHPGKSFAMYKGVLQSKYPVILFLDADLINLQKKHITNLLQPVLKNEADITIGFRDDPLLIFRALGFDPFGGERALKKKLFLEMPNCSDAQFGIESLLNNYIVKQNKRVGIVTMDKVKHTMKYKKRGLVKGWQYEIQMHKQILRSISITRLLKDVYLLKKRIIVYGK